MQGFLDWFRSVFPYYYDNCVACGRFSREIHRAFLGASHPSGAEASAGRASKCEFFHCPECGSVTRFPRFNAAGPICENRRGRCGEYSLLLFRMLRVLGHAGVRYVVDCDNGHVWVEVRQDATDDGGDRDGGGANATGAKNWRWMHLDPCEAAVDKKLLYQEWGRNIKSVFAFYAPPPGESNQPAESSIPTIQDVTNDYRSGARRGWFVGRRQRTVDDVSAALRDQIAVLRKE